MVHTLKTKPPEASAPATLEAAPATLGAGQRWRWRIIVASFLLAVALPTLVVAIYFTFFAANQYAAETRFSVRSATTTQAPNDLLGLISVAPAATITDAYVLIDFVRSRQLLDRLHTEMNYKAVFSRPEADFWARLDTDLPMEKVILYWRRMVSIGFDTTSQIVTLQTRAFRQADALQLANAILKQSEHLINDLSARARADAVKMAEQELAQSEARLRLARLAVRTFREERQEIDPRKKAEARQQIIETLQGELTSARARLQTMRQQLAENAPTVVYQRSVIKALEKQIDEERSRAATSATAADDSTIGGLIADYEALTIDREFAEKAYVSAMGSLERVRFDAARQQRYLATIVAPSLPQHPLYPKSLLNTLIVLVGLFCIWGLAVLIGLAVRDHIA